MTPINNEAIVNTQIEENKNMYLIVQIYWQGPKGSWAEPSVSQTKVRPP